MIPRDYSQPFTITDPVGNNALSFDRRGTAPELWVPSLCQGTVADVTPGTRVVFEDFDEHDVLHSCAGLSHFVKMDWGGIPAVVFDNHNHAFYFWHEALEQGRIARGATLVHIDQHKDMRVPERMYDGHTLADAFDYANFHLNVGNYIVPTERAGLIGAMQLVTSGEALSDLRFASHDHKILNIDLDFFAPEMSYIDFDLARRFIDAHRPGTALITVATSPFFIEQDRAIAMLQRLMS